MILNSGRSREGGNPWDVGYLEIAGNLGEERFGLDLRALWIPAFARMTRRTSPSPESPALALSPNRFLIRLIRRAMG